MEEITVTCIVGIEGGSNVYIGADSSATYGGTSYDSRNSKVFVRDGIVIGYTSSYRMGQILEYLMEIPKFDGPITSEKYLVQKFIPQMQKTFAENGFMWTENGREIGGEFLIGVMGHLYLVGSDHQVNRSLDSYNSIGSGREFAMGSLATTDIDDIGAKMHPIDRINIAIDAATKYALGVGGKKIILYS